MMRKRTGKHTLWRDYARDAIERWGSEAQLDKAVEECAELIDAIQKYKRATDEVEQIERGEHLIKEAVDVSLMLDSIREMFEISPTKWGGLRRKKVRRLRKRLAKEENNGAS